MRTSFKRKPEWLRKKINFSAQKEVEMLMAKGRLHTVCQEAMCPNISECFSKRQATFLIMGNICTRQCSFCNVSKGTPEQLSEEEPAQVAQTVMELGLKHVVITSPTRDDLDDGGALHYIKTVDAIKTRNSSVTVELLIPDMKENVDALNRIARCGAEIIGHNVETVPRLYHIRKGAVYRRSLRVLERLASSNNTVTKSGIMLGLGEREDEVLALMQDLLNVECKMLSIGQYLAPSTSHAQVIEYISPEQFEHYRQKGLEMGFTFIKSSPYTRSSYMAHEYLEEA